MSIVSVEPEKAREIVVSRDRQLHEFEFVNMHTFTIALLELRRLQLLVGEGNSVRKLVLRKVISGAVKSVDLLALPLET
jgi:hypothetical protein